MKTFAYIDGIFEGIELTGHSAAAVADYFGVEHYGNNARVYEECEIKATVERKSDKSIAQFCIVVDGAVFHERLTDDEFCKAMDKFDK